MQSYGSRLDQRRPVGSQIVNNWLIVKVAYHCLS